MNTMDESRQPQRPLHVPVLVGEVVEWLSFQSRERSTAGSPTVVVDGTFGGGGHSAAILERANQHTRIIALDRDAEAVERGRERNADPRLEIHHANYRKLSLLLDQLGITAVDAILLDIGISSDQLSDDARGFSFDSEGPLDLRMDTSLGTPAADLVNRLSERELADLIYKFGEERLSRRIARRVVAVRADTAITTARQLADIVRRCYPPTSRRRTASGKDGGPTIDPATRTFQSLRIAVNDELGALADALATFPCRLKPGGRLAVISFHSLEDRLVKNAFRDDERLFVLTKKPIRPTDAEVSANPRSRSARLRVAERKEE